jgi:hypothetical protein
MAAELKTVQPNLKVTLAHSRGRLLSAEPLPDSVAGVAADLTRDAGVDVLLNHRLASSTPIKNANGRDAYEVVFENGNKMTASVVIMAVSKCVPTSEYMPKTTRNEEGYVNVRASLQLASTDIANAESHFVIGDLINWSGIKRCGSAMHQGKFAGLNIFQLIERDLSGKEPQYNELDEVPPMIGLAVGKQAVAYGPDGMSMGKEVMQVYFEEDLGLRICWDHLRLGGSLA